MSKKVGGLVPSGLDDKYTVNNLRTLTEACKKLADTDAGHPAVTKLKQLIADIVDATYAEAAPKKAKKLAEHTAEDIAALAEYLYGTIVEEYKQPWAQTSQASQNDWKGIAEGILVWLSART